MNLNNGCADFSTVTPTIECYFKNIEQRLIEKIEEYKDGCIFGCVAWLTSEPILKALSKCKNVQIVVQKEDFIRPDSYSGPYWKKNLHTLYSKISCETERHQLPGKAASLSVCSDPSVSAIRCVGNHNSDKNPAFPRSHHKFLVFCKQIINEWNTEYIALAVWTGSFNLTHNATNSFENVVFIKEPKEIIQSYLDEWAQVFSFSESLNWENNWCEPEYRIGT